MAVIFRVEVVFNCYWFSFLLFFYYFFSWILLSSNTTAGWFYCLAMKITFLSCLSLEMPLERSPAPELLAPVHQYEQPLLSRRSVTYQFSNASAMFLTYQSSSSLPSVNVNPKCCYFCLKVNVRSAWTIRSVGFHLRLYECIFSIYLL